MGDGSKGLASIFEVEKGGAIRVGDLVVTQKVPLREANKSQIEKSNHISSLDY